MASLAQRLAADPKLKAKYLANPGLRSKLPSSMLTAKQRGQRSANTAAKKPVTPGSTLTTGQLATEAKAAADVRYGPQERALGVERARAVQAGTDMGGFYEQYQAELAKHAQNTQAINQQALGQMAAVSGGLTALDQGTLTARQGEANTSAQQRGASAANQGPGASNASLVRQQALAGFANQQAATGAATNRYADTRANVVTPTQQLQARAQSARGVKDIGDKLTGVAADRGAFDLNYRAGRTSDEAKNVLALQALGTGMEKALLTSEDKRKQRVTTNRNADQSRTLTANTNAQRLKLEAERVRIAKANAGGKGSAAAKKTSDKATTSIRTAAADIQGVRGKPQPKRDPLGKPLPAPTDPKTGLPTGAPAPTYIPTDQQIRTEIRRKYKDVDIANAAMDLALNGYISPTNVRRLRERGVAVPAALTRRPRSTTTMVSEKSTGDR